MREGFGEGAVFPLQNFFLDFRAQNGDICCILVDFFYNFRLPVFTRNCRYSYQNDIFTPTSV